MRKTQLLGIVGVLLVVAGMSLLLQSTVLAQEATPEVTPVPYTGFGAPLQGEPPYLADIYNKWVGSGHADTTAAAFTDWDSEGSVPNTCARCHTTPGYIDYVGGDGSEALKVDAEVEPIGTVITCDACHNSAASQLRTVTFNSGVTIEDVGRSARCMACHQGRASTDSVNAAIEKAALADDNTVSADLRFINIHYYAAAATLYGGEARGGYQYEGKFYQPRTPHPEPYNTCAACHDQHSLQVRVDECAACHEDVETVDDLKFIRMNGSLADYDGDGDTLEGIAEEIDGVREVLYQAMQTYAKEISKTPIAYSAEAYPYFFVDKNDNGEVDEDEAVRDNGYNAFTVNLLRAAYNYQVSVKDPGAFAHNPKYIIELLYDSIQSLNQNMQTQVDTTAMHRDDIMHFALTGEPFRHWDTEGEVPAGCARCHSAQGLPFYLENGVNIAEPVSQGLACSTCHDVANDFEIRSVDEVTFPSGAKVSFGEGNENNLCITCHQGRESTVSVNAAITKAGVGDDEVSPQLAFRNVHYFAAGATKFGTEVKGAYEFADQQYNGFFQHNEDFQACADCHNVHSGEIKVDQCADCHDGVETEQDTLSIRMEPEGATAIDYNGNGDATEPIAAEIKSFEDALLAAIQKYAKDTAGADIAYSSAAYPYFFVDINGNGTVDAEEANNDNRYVNWTPNLLRAAYNYQYAQKDPGVFAHNPDYIMQVLYDSIKAVGGDVSSFTRPPVAAPAPEATPSAS